MVTAISPKVCRLLDWYKVEVCTSSFILCNFVNLACCLLWGKKTSKPLMCIKDKMFVLLILFPLTILKCIVYLLCFMGKFLIHYTWEAQPFLTHVSLHIQKTVFTFSPERSFIFEMTFYKISEKLLQIFFFFFNWEASR